MQGALWMEYKKKPMQLKLNYLPVIFFFKLRKKIHYLLWRPNVHILKKTTIIFFNDEHSGSL